MVYQVKATLFCEFNFFRYFIVYFGVPVLQAEILQFGFNPVETQSMGQRGIKVDGLTGNFNLFFTRKGAQGAHIVQPVCQLNKNHPNII